MDYRVSYEHSLKNAPDEFIVHVPSQLVEDIPANVPRALLPEYITDLILKRSPRIGRFRHHPRHLRRWNASLLETSTSPINKYGRAAPNAQRSDVRRLTRIYSAFA